MIIWVRSVSRLIELVDRAGYELESYTKGKVPRTEFRLVKKSDGEIVQAGLIVLERKEELKKLGYSLMYPKGKKYLKTRLSVKAVSTFIRNVRRERNSSARLSRLMILV